MKTLFLVYAESLHYCGYGNHWVVMAQDEEEASEIVRPHVNEYFYEQYYDLLEEDGIVDDYYSEIVSVEPFGPEHEDWKFYQDPSQSEFYIRVEK